MSFINKNFKKLYNQSRTYNVKNVILNDTKYSLQAKKYFKNKFILQRDDYIKANKVKVDYVIIGISGLGVVSNIKNNSYTKNLANANKESIIWLEIY